MGRWAIPCNWLFLLHCILPRRHWVFGCPASACGGSGRPNGTTWTHQAQYALALGFGASSYAASCEHAWRGLASGREREGAQTTPLGRTQKRELPAEPLGARALKFGSYSENCGDLYWNKTRVDEVLGFKPHGLRWPKGFLFRKLVG